MIFQRRKNTGEPISKIFLDHGTGRFIRWHASSTASRTLEMPWEGSWNCLLWNAACCFFVGDRNSCFLWLVNFFCATVWMGNIEICRMHIDTWKTETSAWQTARDMLVNYLDCETSVTTQSASATHSLKSVTYHSSLHGFTKNDIPIHMLGVGYQMYQTHGPNQRKSRWSFHTPLSQNPTCATLFWPSPWLLFCERKPQQKDSGVYVAC